MCIYIYIFHHVLWSATIDTIGIQTKDRRLDEERKKINEYRKKRRKREREKKTNNTRQVLPNQEWHEIFHF